MVTIRNKTQGKNNSTMWIDEWAVRKLYVASDIYNWSYRKGKEGWTKYKLWNNYGKF